MKLWRLAVCGPIVLLLGAAFESPARADAGAALRALDLGDGAAARPALAAEIAQLSFYQALAERGDARKAAAERASTVAPEGSWVRDAAAGLLAAEADRSAEAIAAYERAVAAAPNEARIWRLLGDLKADADDRAGAKAAYQRATTIDPAYPLALVGLGHALRQEGDFQGAYNAFDHAASEAPAGSPPAAAAGAQTHGGRGRGPSQGHVGRRGQPDDDRAHLRQRHRGHHPPAGHLRRAGLRQTTFHP